MPMTAHRQAALAAALLFALPMAHAADPAKEAYKAQEERISATYKADKARCDSLSGNAKDICIEEAKGQEKVARAELEFSRTNKPADHTKALTAKADAVYAVAKERCDDLAGNPKDVCVKEAKAEHTKALADAKVGRVVGDARRDAAKDKVDADYDVAKEKCDALAGDAKANCVTAAKRLYGKG